MGAEFFNKRSFNFKTYKKRFGLLKNSNSFGVTFFLKNNSRLSFSDKKIEVFNNNLYFFILNFNNLSLFFNSSLFFKTLNVFNSTKTNQNTYSLLKTNHCYLNFFNFIKSNYFFSLRNFYTNTNKFKFATTPSSYLLKKKFKARALYTKTIKSEDSNKSIVRGSVVNPIKVFLYYVFKNVSVKMKLLLKKNIYDRKFISKKFKNFKFLPYSPYSKLFFNDLTFSKKLKSKNDSSVFKVQIYDYFSDSIIKLTPQSLNYSFSDFLNLNNTSIVNNTDLFSCDQTTTYPYSGFVFSTAFARYSLYDDFFNLSFSKSSNFKNNKNITMSSYLSRYFQKNYNYFSRYKVDSVRAHLSFKKSLNVATTSTTSGNNNKSFLKGFMNIFYSTSRHTSIKYLVSNPFLLKYYFFKNNNFYSEKFTSFNFFNSLKSTSYVIFNVFDKYFSLLSDPKTNTNVFPNSNFSYIFKKFVIKSFRYHKFSFSSMPWHYNTLIKFLEYSSGKKIFLNANSFLNNVLDLSEIARCEIWSQRLKSFKKSLGPKLFINESLQIIYTSLKIKDPFFLSNWLLNFFYKISFWKFKLVFRYLQYVLRYFFWPIFNDLNLKGLKFQLKGKVSVAGNSRTRTVVNKIGLLSNSTFKNRILYDLNLIRTFTGVIGFKTWLVF